MIQYSDLTLMKLKTDEDFLNFLIDPTIVECIDERKVVKSASVTIHTKRKTNYGYYAVFTNYNPNRSKALKSTMFLLYDIQPDKTIKCIDLIYKNLLPKTLKPFEIYSLKRSFFNQCIIECLLFLEKSSSFKKEFQAIELDAKTNESNLQLFVNALIYHYEFHTLKISSMFYERTIANYFERIHVETLFKENYDYISLSKAIIYFIDHHKEIKDEEWLIAMYLKAFKYNLNVLDDEKRRLFEIIKFVSNISKYQIETKSGETKDISKSSLSNIFKDKLKVVKNKCYFYDIPMDEISVIKTKDQTYHVK